jgi:hypothetical protein
VIVALALACAPPFDQTRKDLRDFQLVGMRADADGASNLAAAVWSGEGAFHSTAPTVAWFRNGAEVDAVAGKDVEVSVRVEDAAGRVEEGLLAVEDTSLAPSVTGFTRTVLPVGATLEIGVEGDAYTRWKASSGSFVETGPNGAEWTAADAPLTTIFALTLDGRGGNVFTWIDVATDDGPYLAVGGRLLPVEAAVDGAGDWLATLTPADNLAGIVLTDVVPAADEPGDIVCALEPFDADALVDGRCGLDEAAGARVRLTGAPWP